MLTLEENNDIEIYRDMPESLHNTHSITFFVGYGLYTVEVR